MVSFWLTRKFYGAQIVDRSLKLAPQKFCLITPLCTNIYIWKCNYMFLNYAVPGHFNLFL